MVNDLKRELSKLSGIDFYNPKYRDVFKKYFPNDNTENDVNDNEEERLKQVIGEDAEQVDTEKVDKQSTEALEDEEVKEDSVDTEDDALIEKDKPAEDIKDDNIVLSDEGLEKSEMNNQTQEGIAEKETFNQNDFTKELLEMKVELALVRAGVREDRLDAARKLFMADIHSIEDLSKLDDLVKQYPEWIKQDKQEAQPFGMPLGDVGDGLTEEEKRLKSMGIDPRA